MILFYHIAVIHDTQSIIDRQFNNLKSSGLLDDLEYIYITILGDAEAIKIPIELESKANVMYSEDLGYYENITINRIVDSVPSFSSNKALFYMHTKGSSHKGNMREYSNSWSKAMEFFCIEHYSQCIHNLEDYDTCGIFWSPYHHHHYQGNFWWANTDYLKTLPKLTPETSLKNNPLSELDKNHGILRHDAELWVLRNKDVRYLDMYPLKVNPYKEHIPEDYLSYFKLLGDNT